MTGPAIKTPAQPRRFWPLRGAQPPSFTPHVPGSRAGETLPNHRLTACELIAMARAARARRAGA